MAHGFGAERSWKLPDYASYFASQGFAVYLFDYRNFGDSEGSPRQWVSPARHISDYRAAIAKIKTFSEVDAGKIALWGASFSGGHALMTASTDPSVKAVSVLVPFLDAWASLDLVHPLLTAAGLAVGAADWLASNLIGLDIPMGIVGKPGDFAFLTFPGWYEEIMENLPAGSRWENKMPARSLLEIVNYRPIEKVDQVKAPTQIIYGAHDHGIKPALVEAAVAKMRGAMGPDSLEAHKWRMNHFGPFSGPFTRKAMEEQARFLKERLG